MWMLSWHWPIGTFWGVEDCLQAVITSGPQWDALPPFLRLRDRWMDAGYPQSYAAWDDEQMVWELQAAAALHPDGYTLRRLGYRKLLGSEEGGVTFLAHSLDPLNSLAVDAFDLKVMARFYSCQHSV
eukprot:gene2784-3081_t